MSRKQGVTEKGTEYLQALKTLAKDCSFQRVTRQRLLERYEITLQQAHKMAERLERAHI